MKEQEIQENMNKSIEATQRNFNTIRTGRANSSLLDRVSVEYYGAETPIKALATISTVDSQTIAIQPFDISCLQAIEKSISMSDLGITPNNDGKVIRINVPPLTEERRKEFCKLANLQNSFLLSSVKGGTFILITLPSLFGVIPKSLIEIDFSIACKHEISNG